MNTFRFLRCWINYWPKQYKDDKTLLKQLKSQCGLARLESEERNIKSCALNTFKANADQVIRGGFEKIDQLRKNAVNAIEFEIKGKKTRKGNMVTAIGQKSRIKEQKIEEKLKNTDLPEEKKEQLLDELNDIRADLIEIEAEKQDRNKII